MGRGIFVGKIVGMNRTEVAGISLEIGAGTSGEPSQGIKTGIFQRAEGD